MVTNNTILSAKDMSFLEEVVVRFGRIVSFDQLQEVFKKHYSLGGAKNRIARLARLGWLIRLKKGLFIVITDIGSLSTRDISLFTISQALNNDSYVSFENALQYHGMFDQMLSSVGSITFKQARRYKINEIEIRFFKIKKELYFGFAQERSDIGLVNIASKEKALLDILYFRSNVYYAGLVLEKLSAYKKNFDFILLKEYAKKFNLDIIRQIGFFLDHLGIDTMDLAKIISGKKGYSRMTKESVDFNSKWRLYFDRRIIK